LSDAAIACSIDVDLSTPAAAAAAAAAGSAPPLLDDDVDAMMTLHYSVDGYP